MRRIAIVGPCGAGKSTLARTLGDITGLPVWHLDKIWWLPGWIEDTPERFDEKLKSVVDMEEWIIDGNYSRTFNIRLPKADTVIYLDFPRRIYFRRVLWRIIKGYGKTRPDLADNCPERFDLEFLHFVWNIPKKSRPRTQQFLAEYEGQFALYTFRKPKEVKQFLEKVKGSFIERR
ncbi:MAG: topology modulation protein [Candidatus Kapaibacterium sp.]